MQEDVLDFDDALEPQKGSTQVQIEPQSEIDGRFYHLAPQPQTPAWVSFVQPILTQRLKEIKASSTAALLLLRASNRIFALPFGYGRSLLDLSKIEYQFGLRVALNKIDPSQIRSLDTKTFEDLVVSTNTQTSKSTELPTFGVDVSRDILRAVTGEPRDHKLSRRISGADSLVMNLKVTPAQLPGICEELLATFSAEDYKADFGWIDQLALVRDQSAINVLNDLLVGQLREGETGSTHLAMPEGIEWEDIDGFRIAGTRDRVYEELELDEYLDRLGGERSQITLEVLKSRRVSVRFGRSGEFDSRWSLYKCLVSEQRVGGRLHVLIENRWFVVNSTLVEEVDAFVDSLPPARVELPEARPGEIESDYNTRLAETLPDNFLKLDARIKRPGGASSGIEFCDVLSDKGDIIHVKRKSRSATLSHLFAQGRISASTFVNDQVFRDEVRKLVATESATSTNDEWLHAIPGVGERLDQSKYCVTYVVIANSKRAGNDWLPFFSKLNLMQQGRGLLSMGFKVAVARVPVSSSGSGSPSR